MAITLDLGPHSSLHVFADRGWVVAVTEVRQQCDHLIEQRQLPILVPRSCILIGLYRLAALLHNKRKRYFSLLFYNVCAIFQLF